MSAHSASRDELLSSLRHYTSVLQTQRDALTRISDSTCEMRLSLKSSGDVDVSELLEQRERDCHSLASVCRDPMVSNPSLAAAAREIAETASGEISALAGSALTLRADIETLGQQILSCQSECEQMMKTRLESLGRALKQSAQRRKLDSAYGPACSHETPRFLDRQR